jgi:conjugative relaxase-like TrwC/TraI family protein
MVISIKMLEAGPDPAGYYLSRQGGCPADYYLGAEPAGRWLGAGGAAAGLTGRFDPAAAQQLRHLLAGASPGGEPLVPQVLRADPRGLLPAAPLVEAVRARAADQSLPVQALFAEPRDGAAFAAMTGRVDRPYRGRTATVDPARAGRIAAAAGLDAREIYRGEDGTDHYAQAMKYAGRRVDRRRPGLDVTVSAPKSVSILFALADPDVSAQVRAAHQAAVSEVVDYLESVAGHALRGHHGDGQRAARIGTDGWIVAAFEHRTSRAGDPQLHTHLVVPNVLRSADGKWSAVDSKAVFRHALTGSYLYHSVLRGQLTERLGVGWTTPVKGIAEVDGMPADLMDTFSTRRRQIIRAMGLAGHNGPAAAQAACLATRPDKAPEEPEQTLRQRWAAKSRAAGHRPARVVADVLGRSRILAAPPVDRLAAHLLGPTGLTAQATGFDRRDLLQALCESLPPGLPVIRAQIESAADRVLRHRDTIRLATRTEDGGRWTTTELLAIEQAALHLAKDLRDGPAPAVGRGEAVNAPAAPRLSSPARRGGTASAGLSNGLSAEQQDMVSALAATSGLAVVVGPAGAGKTAAIAAAAQVWAEHGRPVRGAAVAAVTARRLEHATGIPATSLTRILGVARRADPATGRPAGLPRGGVLVVDEASMVDTRTLAALLAETRSAGGTLVLVGDPAQLPEIGAGGLFAALARHPGTITLTDNRRQTEAWERRALADLRAGDPDAAVAAYATHGRVHTAPGDRLPDRVVADYLRLRGDTDSRPQDDSARWGERVIMVALRRSDVTELNDTTRDRLLEAGGLGPEAVTAGRGSRAREYRAGDEVLVTANDHRLGLLNGSRGKVTAVDPRRRTLTLGTDEHQQVTVPAEWAARHLDHGYAMTCHKAQGATVEVALLYGTGPLTREAGYVAMSRGRTANHLYVAEADDRGQFAAGDGLDRVAARLAVRRSQALATRQLPRTQPDRWQTRRHEYPALPRIEGISR